MTDFGVEITGRWETVFFKSTATGSRYEAKFSIYGDVFTLTKIEGDNIHFPLAVADHRTLCEQVTDKLRIHRAIQMKRYEATTEAKQSRRKKRR